MRKGFTLIELLAVIVILAIIALIATPIILGIINDARKESQERSIELYASAAKNAIAKYQLNNTSSPTSFDQLDIEYDGDVVCTTKELYSDGSIYLAGCTVNGDAVDYTYGEQKGTSVAKTCTIQRQDTSKYSIGDVVTCTLSESTDKFYIIAEADLTVSAVQMLTEKNISTSTNRQSDNAGVLKFSESNYWDSYPVPNPSTDENGFTIMRYVYDENSNLYPHVNNYETYLKNNGLNILNVKLMDYHKLDEIESNLENPYWAHSTSYWLGNDEYTGCIFYINSIPDQWGSYMSYTCVYCASSQCEPTFDDNALYGIRPVITISTSDIG